MRHKNRGRKFGRHSHQREALGRHTVVNLIRQFGDEEKPFILTTQAKAKEFSAVAEKFITMAKKANECVKEAAALAGLSEEEVRKGWSGAIRERRELRRVAKIKKRAAFRKEAEPKVEAKDVFAKDPEMRAATGRFKALAEEKRAQVDRLLARALHLRRLAASRMHDEDATKKLFDDIAPAYADRKGGYTRVLKTGVRRLGDGTLKAMLAFTPA